MYPKPTPKAEQCRLRVGPTRSGESAGNNGQFIIPGPEGIELLVQISDGRGWEHASVSTRKRVPTWKEMCFVKNLFWQPEECVVQFHPPKSRYVNLHPYVLHLWRPIFEGVLPMPPVELV